jgi:hypothetical protein
MASFIIFLYEIGLTCYVSTTEFVINLYSHAHSFWHLFMKYFVIDHIIFGFPSKELAGFNSIILEVIPHSARSFEQNSLSPLSYCTAL